jgi:O-antigen ligase
LRVESGAAARGRTLARFVSAFVFAALVIILPLSAAPYGSVEAWWTALFDAAVFLLAALWAVEGALSGRWLTQAHVVTLPILLLAALALLQSAPLPALGAISFDPYESRLIASRLLAVALYCALIIRYADTERRLKAVVYAVVLAGLASAFFGIARQTMQRGEQGFVLAYLQPNSGYAQFINKNHFAYLAEMSLGLLLGLAAGRGVARQKILVPVALTLPVWAALVLSNSRGGVLAMLCQIVFLALTFGVTRRDVARADRSKEGRAGARENAHASAASRLASSPAARVALAVLLLATIVVGTVWVGGDPLAERMGSVASEVAAEGTDPTRTGRAEIWKATWEMFKHHPAVGAGLGGYWIAVSSYHEASGAGVPQQAHNDYLELLASGGAVGFCLLLLFVYLFSQRARARLREGTPFARAAALGALAGLFGVAVHSLFDFGLHATVNALAAAALVAVACAGVGREPKN